MVRCVVCPNFTRATCHCKHYSRTIKPDDIHKQISCPGFPNRARQNWILNVAHREAVPEEQAKVYYQLLPEEAKQQ